MVRIDTLLDSWKTVRQDTAQAVEDMPESDMDFRPVPEVMTFREIARHILASTYALSGLLLDGVEKIDRQEMIKRFHRLRRMRRRPCWPPNCGRAWTSASPRCPRSLRSSTRG